MTITPDDHNALQTLKHIIQPLPGGGKILILETGAVIDPESTAMLQALHSRSVGGIEAHLHTLSKKGAGKFMSNFYVGYGHKSIGDCGTCTIFIEGVSMLAAKAIQDWPLYSGQESSTRYIDFSSQRFIDPVRKNETNDILERWRDFYLKGLDILIQSLKGRYPLKENEKENIYEKAIKARAFDIMRGFLPAGASTNLSWHTNLRQARDHIDLLRHHPLKEVRIIGETMENALIGAYPSSFTVKRYALNEGYHAMCMREDYYFSSPTYYSDFALTGDTISREMLVQRAKILQERPPKSELPKSLAEVGTMQFSFLLDFGSFRDIQRHRAVSQRMPLLTMEHGFAPWYLEEMPETLRNEARTLLAYQKSRIKRLIPTPEVAQYYIPMGYNIPNRVTGTLPSLVYLVELRATRFVHPTLRKRAQQMAEVLEGSLGACGLVLHLDDEPDRFDIKRGEHDITEK